MKAVGIHMNESIRLSTDIGMGMGIVMDRYIRSIRYSTVRFGIFGTAIRLGDWLWLWVW
jgi:hypothetical protein